jgi:hypothetical protein
MTALCWGDRRNDRAASLQTNGRYFRRSHTLQFTLSLRASQHGSSYQGQVVVCSVKFLPVAAYDPKHFLVTYLAAQHETEIWLAPLGGTRLLVPYRASISTPMGLGKVCVDHFRGKCARRTLGQPDRRYASPSEISQRRARIRRATRLLRNPIVFRSAHAASGHAAAALLSTRRLIAFPKAPSTAERDCG